MSYVIKLVEQCHKECDSGIIVNFQKRISHKNVIKCNKMPQKYTCGKYKVRRILHHKHEFIISCVC